MDTKSIITLAETYCAHRKRKLSTISTYAVGDGKRFKHFKNDGGCTLKTAARAVAWFDTNWPADLAWPKHITRPSVEPRASGRAA